jgi:hypothetical protein
VRIWDNRDRELQTTLGTDQSYYQYVLGRFRGPAPHAPQGDPALWVNGLDYETYMAGGYPAKPCCEFVMAGGGGRGGGAFTLPVCFPLFSQHYLQNTTDASGVQSPAGTPFNAFEVSGFDQAISQWVDIFGNPVWGVLDCGNNGQYRFGETYDFVTFVWLTTWYSPSIQTPTQFLWRGWIAGTDYQGRTDYWLDVWSFGLLPFPAYGGGAGGGSRAQPGGGRGGGAFAFSFTPSIAMSAGARGGGAATQFQVLELGMSAGARGGGSGPDAWPWFFLWHGGGAGAGATRSGIFPCFDMSAGGAFGGDRGGARVLWLWAGGGRGGDRGSHPAWPFSMAAGGSGGGGARGETFVTMLTSAGGGTGGLDAIGGLQVFGTAQGGGLGGGAAIIAPITGFAMTGGGAGGGAASITP